MHTSAAVIAVLACVATCSAFVPVMPAAVRAPSTRVCAEEGGNPVSDLFSGAKEAASKAVDSLSSDEHEVPAGDTVINSKQKASRFRVDPDRKEGETSANSFVKPTPTGAPSGGGPSWNISSQYDKDFGSFAGTIKARAGDYMKGAISPHDMAMAMRKSGISNEKALEVIGTMPSGQKRAELFDLYTQF